MKQHGMFDFKKVKIKLEKFLMCVPGIDPRFLSLPARNFGCCPYGIICKHLVGMDLNIWGITLDYFVFLL